MFFLVILIFLAIIIKLGVVALNTEVDDFNFSAFIDSRNKVTKDLLSKRGNIYDFAGSDLASTVNSYTVIAYLSESRTTDLEKPQHVVDIDNTAKSLSTLLSIDYDSLIKTLSKDKYQVEIVRNITELTKKQIDDLHLPGIGFEQSNTRYYPNGTFASYLVGYAKKTEDLFLVGELGIEGFYNEILTGKNGSITYQRDAYGYQMPNTPVYEEKEVNGADIYLTIDSNIQFILENAMSKLSEYKSVDWSIISVMDANTGAILGSATNPSFNPNNLNTIGDNYLNPLVSYQYEPGSTMKAFSFGAAIEEGLYKGDEVFTSGSLDVTGVTIRDFNRTGWGDITFDTGFAYSSNVAASTLGLRLGVGKLTDYYKSLGFSKKTDIELSNEYSGLVNFKYDVELANAAFGQGVSVTPVQVLQAFTSIANDGVVLKPYIVDKIVDENNKILYEGKKEELNTVYSKSTTDYLKKLMKDAVYSGTSSYYIPKNVNIIGKTGTAQIAESGKYLTGEHDYVRSFVSIFPEEKPKYIFYIAASKYDGALSDYGKIITTAIEEIASYANITNNETESVVNETVNVDNYISKQIQNININQKLNKIIIGDGAYITDQYPQKGQTLFAGDKLFLKTNSTNIVMPDLTNYSSSDLKIICSLLNLNYTQNGYGYILSQSIAPGTILTGSENLEVNLSDR